MKFKMKLNMKLNYLQSSALFMILLIISFPIYTSSVFAQDDSAGFDVYTLNKEGVKKYRAKSDKIAVVAEIDLEGVSKEDVRLVNSNNAAFTSCTTQNGKSICRYEFSEGIWPGGSHTFTVSYGSSTKSTTVVVDDYAPTAAIIGIDNGKELSVSYDIRESISESSSKCSGIKRLNFVLGGVVVNTTMINGEPDRDCSINGRTSTFTVPSTNNVEKLFCVDVFDGAGNKGSSCKYIIVDKESSSASNPRLVKSNGDRIDFVTAKVGPILNARARFTLNEQNIASIRADASDFSFYDLQKQEMIDVAGSCNPSNCNGTCSCDIPITLNLPNGGNPVLRIKTLDYSGNEADLSLTYTVTADNEAPYVKTFSAKQCGDKNALGLSNNTINVVVVDSGAGLNDGLIWLDLTSAMGGGYSHINKRNCTNIGNEWGCSFGVFGVTRQPLPGHGSSLSIAISPDSQDDAGNNIESEPGSFFFDSRAPNYIEHSIRGVKNVAFQEDIEGYPISGGTIELKVTMFDDLPVSASADFSGVAYMGKKSAYCEGNVNKTCTFTEIGPLIDGPKFNLKIPVTISDCVGNKKQIDLLMNISEIKGTGSGGWSYSVAEPTPSAIDKSTLDVIEHSMFFPLKGNSAMSNTPISQKITECPAGQTNYLTSNDDGNRVPTLLSVPSRDPLMQVKFQRGIPDPGDSLTFTCTVRTISRTSSGIITPPENDNITFTVPFIHDPLGSIDEAAQNKVAAVRNSSIVSGGGAKIISKLQKWLDFFDSLCKLWQTILSIASAIDSIAALLCTPPLTVLPHCEGAEQTGVATSYLSENALGKIISPMCDYISCEKVPLLSGVSNTVRDAISTWRNNPTALVGVDFDVARILNTTGSINPRDSLIFSIGTLCIPGVIYNLNKARQIECAYIYCMEKVVPGGTPPYFCDAQRATMWCKYVWHEVFMFIPWTHAINQFLAEVGQAIRTPLGVASAAIATCNKLVKPASAWCRIPRHVMTITSVVTRYTQADAWKQLNFHSTSTRNFCSEVGL